MSQAILGIGQSGALAAGCVQSSDVIEELKGVLTNVNSSGSLLMVRKHSKPEIADAIKYALSKGWRFEQSGSSGHAFGRLYCPQTGRDGCQFSVWSTPRSARNHADQIRRNVDRCKH